MAHFSWRWLLAGVFLGSAAGVIAFFGLPDQVDEASARQRALAEQLESISQGSEAPEFALQTVDGGTFRLSDHQGDVVLLNFWATWCGPCRVEMPALQQQYERRSSAGFVVAGVNAGESRQDVMSFGRELGLTFPLLLDPDEEVQRLYQIRAYPTSILVDQEGRIGRVHFGVLTEDLLDQYLMELGVGS